MLCLGAGSWGTALAILLASNGFSVCLWGRDSEKIKAMANTRENSQYLPGVKFPEQLNLSPDLHEAMTNAETIVIAVPSHAVRALFIKLVNLGCGDKQFLLAAKGLECETGKFMHDVFEEEINHNDCFALIAGPSFAKEVASAMPTAVALASKNKAFANELIQTLHNKNFRPYYCSDVIGAEIGGVVKNIIAIAVGIADGLGLGANAKSALITRGLAEMVRLGRSLGGQSETFLGLSGVGDLVLTCTDNQSRNRRFGLALGQGVSADEAFQQIGQVVEGARNAKEVYHLAQKHGVEMPITEQVYRLLHEAIKPAEVVAELMQRDIKEEIY